MGTLARTAVVVGLALLVPAAVLVYASFERSGTTTVAIAPAPAAAAAPAGPPRPVGAGGCSAAGCHGASPARSLTAPPDEHCWQSSATHWMAADPHTKAYAVLMDDGPARPHDLATKIMIQLTGKKANGRPNTEATEHDRCLACHTNPSLVSANAGTIGPRMVGLRAEGVGCEACHGNASTWYGPHTGKTWDAAHRPSLYENHGMPKLYDLGERALMCAGCHVGAPADERYPMPRDMNHDMIAAGHPRLNFDFAEYQRRLPPHWQEKDRLSPSSAPRTDPAFEVKCWLVGRVATAEAACKLTADRAARLDPWPEFAEFNCYSCHHELQKTDDSWRQKAPGYYTGRSPGATPWQTVWPVTGHDPLAGVPGAAAAAGDVKALLAVIGTGKLAAGPVGSAAANAAKSLKTLRDQLTHVSERDAASATLRLLATLRKPDAVLDWDTAGQAYLGAAAVERARLRLNPGAKVSPAFGSVAEELRFPREGATPEEKFNSPHRLDPATTRKSFEALLQALPPEWPPR